MVLLLIQSCLAVDSSTPQCKPQGMLKLDKPFPPPLYSEITFLFCEQYQQCSCCNASHVVALEKKSVTQKLGQGKSSEFVQAHARSGTADVNMTTSHTAHSHSIWYHVAHDRHQLCAQQLKS
ncbi:hypothetical protein WJX77_012366 [Trebouxia sp. C0004]